LQSRQWSLNFVNSATGILSVPTVGEFKEGVGEFYDWEEYNGRMILVRNVWKDITPTSCRFEQAYSDDGGKTWELNWIAVDTRIEQEPAPPMNEAPTDFNFEIGSWSVHHTRLLYPLTDSTRTIEFEGTSVARKLWNGRGVLIELGSDPPSGHTEALIWRTYNPNARQWNVYVANSGVGVLSAASVGGFSNGQGEFYAMEQLDDGRTVLARTVLSDITPTSYTAEQAYSLDGGRRWVVVWTSLHRRR
jgi:hypothetical protein